MDDWKKRFYNCKEWRQMRASIISRDKYICQYCGKVIFDSPTVHHEIELTESNYKNPEISLNPELLKTVHHECHNIIHERFGHCEKETIVDDDLNIDYSRR